MDDVAVWFKWLNQATGIKLTIFYDSYDRSRFIEGLLTTLEVSAVCLVISLVLGAVVAWLYGSRSALVRASAHGYVQLFRNTPPLVQIYFFYFAIGPLLPKVGGAPVVGSIGWVKTTTLGYAIAVPELLYMSSQIWSEQVNVPSMMMVLLVTYVVIVGVINQVMQWLEARMRVPGFGQ